MQAASPAARSTRRTDTITASSVPQGFEVAIRGDGTCRGKSHSMRVGNADTTKYAEGQYCIDCGFTIGLPRVAN